MWVFLDIDWLMAFVIISLCARVMTPGSPFLVKSSMRWSTGVEPLCGVNTVVASTFRDLGLGFRSLAVSADPDEFVFLIWASLPL